MSDFFLAHVRNACVYGTLALLMVYAVCRLFSRISPHTSSWLWRLGYLKLLVAFIVVGSICIPVLPSNFDKTPLGNAQVNYVSASPEVGGQVSSPAAHSVTPMSPAPHAGALDMAQILALIWCAGVIFFGIRITSAWLKTKAFRRTCVDLGDDQLKEEVSELCRRIGIRRVPRLMTGDVNGPLICGLFSQIIVFPARTLTESNQSDLRLILAHELAHVKRRDLIWACVPIISQCLFFFNPIVWLMRREWVFAQEAACDALALQSTCASPSDYARMLLEYVTKASMKRQLMAAGIVEPYETLKRRLNAMKYFGTIARSKQIALGAVIGILGILGMIPWAVGAVRQTRATAPLIAGPRQVIVLQAVTHESAKWDEIRSRQLQVLSARIRAAGFEGDVKASGADKVLVSVPKSAKRDDLVRLLTSTSLFELRGFRSVQSNRNRRAPYRMEIKTSAGGNAYQFHDSAGKQVSTNMVINASPLVISGADISSVKVSENRQMHQQALRVELTPAGASRFAQYTKKNTGGTVGVVLDGRLVSAPTIMEPIRGNNFEVSDFKSPAEAQRMADILNAGTLPMPMKVSR